MKIKEITEYLENVAPLSFQESYDNAGLIVGDGSTECKGILLCLDSTEAVVDEAIAAGCNLIVAHHPIVFGGLKKFNGSSYVERVVIKALKNDIAIYAIHTNLDNVHNGVNAKIAERIGLINTRVLQPKRDLLKKLVTFVPKEHAEVVRAALFNAGAGKIGNYDECSYNLEGTGTFRANDNADPFVGKKGEQHQEIETRVETIFPAHQESTVVKALLSAHPYEEVAYDIYSIDNKWNNVGSGMIGELPAPMGAMEFLKKLKGDLNTAIVRYTDTLGKSIKTVAVCGGAGSFLLKDAIRQSADVFITADYKYHQFFDAEHKIIIADVGHYESEQFTVELLHDLLIKKFPTFAVRFSKVNTNPVKYL